ncbi:uncharacterized protein LOC112677905 isoform X2 [Canis lupus dingo]|uniref:uncharacterized protein LOC112677905 isoform X2 n=1 Tax=Canis lupus dingo TaxID=286419 RepID=UPI0020C3381D|nr:uncharacterized protein LOC112677905 isoform X2 [Canis lupus dingo]
MASGARGERPLPGLPPTATTAPHAAPPPPGRQGHPNLTTPPLISMSLQSSDVSRRPPFRFFTASSPSHLTPEACPGGLSRPDFPESRAKTKARTQKAAACPSRYANLCNSRLYTGAQSEPADI